MEWNDRTYGRVAGLTALVSWGLLTLLVLAQYLAELYQTQVEVPYFPKALLVNVFILATYWYLAKRSQRPEGSHFYGIVWGVFITGAAGTLGSYLLDLLIVRLTDLDSTSAKLFLNFCYKVEVAIISVFLLNAYVHWKNLLLYQPQRWLRRAWEVFEYLLFGSLLLHFIPGEEFLKPGLAQRLLQTGLFLFFVFSLLLSFNLRWVALLTLRQKLWSLLLMVVLLGCLYYFYDHLAWYSRLRPVVVDLSQSLFLSALLSFVAVYSVFSILILFFNLPTTSLFEQKFSEVFDFQRLLQGRDEAQLYNIMLDLAVNSFKSDAAWLQVGGGIIARNLPLAQAEQLRALVEATGYQPTANRKFSRAQLVAAAPHLAPAIEFESLLVVPLAHGPQWLGTLVLLSRRFRFFDQVVVSLVHTYAAQASVALANFKLVSQAAEHERYQADLLIARRVQASLQPAQQHQQLVGLEWLAHTHSPELIGGDFYDYQPISPHRHVFIIGDVAGKGTSAAFNMSQMKGIFHGLAQLDLPPEVFLDRANAALGRSLAASSFITATYLAVDTTQRQLVYARAGHCPPVLYRAATGQVELLASRGLGLGILRTEQYGNYLETKRLGYDTGDLLLLYTDGLVEAKSPASPGTEFGYERLLALAQQHAPAGAPALLQALEATLRAFTAHQPPTDDQTWLVIAFN
ncbi:MAG: SpoIIE family protein phosphatase [Bernardetiaceae bacterium]|nr:SpoIIE family protein phosphatase [Bernardetiaceae bacterium]